MLDTMPWTLILITALVAGAGLALNGFSPGSVPGKDIVEGRVADNPSGFVPAPTPTPTNFGTVQGRLTYEDLSVALNASGTAFTGVTKTVQPVRFVEVVALDSNTSTSARILSLAPASTDSNGNFSVFVPFDTPFFVAAIARTTASGRANLEVRDASSAVYVFAKQGTADTLPAGTTNVSFNFVPLASTSNGAAVFNILDAGIRGSDKAAALFGTVPTTVTFIWQSDVRNGTFFKQTGGPSGGPAITIQGGNSTADNTDEQDDGVILHEYGHFVAFAFSRDSSLGGPHALSDVENPPLAYSEGLATFYAGLTDATQFNIDTAAINGATPLAGITNLEGGRGVSVPRGIRNEATVFEVLWDLFDGVEGRTSTDQDAVAIAQSAFASVLQTIRGTNRYVQVEDFLELLVATGALSTAQMQALLIAPENQGITFPASGTDIVPVRAEPQPFSANLSVTTRAVNDGQNFPVDASNKFFQADFIVRTQMTASLLINGADGLNTSGTNIDLVILTANNVLAQDFNGTVMTPVSPSPQVSVFQAPFVVEPGRYIFWVHGRPDVTASLSNASSQNVSAIFSLQAQPSP